MALMLGSDRRSLLADVGQLKIAPTEPGPDDLVSIFRESVENW
ncbi:hypothetical protein BH23ACT11_BH23ACT11_12160 [soil metagenome]